ncbi:hypothetical protein KUV50_18635 [Membranicola marinus]|uniref:Holin-X, holin superfamily III n=1 Tax=Membranihabitans marinus TaxID=1227546 RepID=A0A953L8U2_9BACT|nr:hypothetical protein [Membranihabitans marinus]MBY5960177.1 hypothetical protein [Membranihabitans marinus]
MKHFDSLLYALGQLSEYARHYIHGKKQILKLDLTERAAGILSKLISRVVIFIFVIFFILFASLTLAIGLSMYFSSFLAGFGIVSGIYLILIILVIVFRKLLIMRPLIDVILKDINE